MYLSQKNLLASIKMLTNETLIKDKWVEYVQALK